MELFIAVDGGGTKTECFLADGSGRILGRARGGTTNIHTVGSAAACTEIGRLVRAATFSLGEAITEIRAAVIGLAGVDSESDRRAAESELYLILAQQGIRLQKLRVENDAVIALAAATGSEQGVVIVAGTGSIAWGRNARGEEARAGGWGPPLSDEGSAYWLGIEGLKAVLKAYDYSGPPTAMSEVLPPALGLVGPAELAGSFQTKHFPPAAVAALAPLISAVAEDGDAVAGMLLGKAGRELAQLGRAVIGRLGFNATRFSLALAGGVLTGNARVRASLVQELKAAAPYADIVLARRQLVEGALLLAQRWGGPVSRENGTSRTESPGHVGGSAHET